MASPESMLVEVSFAEKCELFPGAKGLPNAGRFLEECVQHLTRRIFEAYLNDASAGRVSWSAPIGSHLVVFCPPTATHVRGKYVEEDIKIYRSLMDSQEEESAFALGVYRAVAGAQAACLILECEASENTDLQKSWLLAVGATRSSAAAWARKIIRPATKGGIFELGLPVPVRLRSLWHHAAVRSFLEGFGCPSEMEECPVEMYAAALAETSPQPASEGGWWRTPSTQTFRTRQADWMENESQRCKLQDNFVSTIKNQMMGTSIDRQHYDAWEVKGRAAGVVR